MTSGSPREEGAGSVPTPCPSSASLLPVALRQRMDWATALLALGFFNIPNTALSGVTLWGSQTQAAAPAVHRRALSRAVQPPSELRGTAKAGRQASGLCYP